MKDTQIGFINAFFSAAKGTIHDNELCNSKKEKEKIKLFFLISVSYGCYPLTEMAFRRYSSHRYWCHAASWGWPGPEWQLKPSLVAGITLSLEIYFSGLQLCLFINRWRNAQKLRKILSRKIMRKVGYLPYSLQRNKKSALQMRNFLTCLDVKMRKNYFSKNS